jgi:hypothetical protein
MIDPATEKPIFKTVRVLTKLGGRVLDYSFKNGILNNVEGTIGRYYPLDVLINNADVMPLSRFDSLKVAE